MSARRPARPHSFVRPDPRARPAWQPESGPGRWPDPRLCVLALVVAALLLLVATGPADAQPAGANGFSFEPSAIPAEEIHRGGPPRDGIPALDDPDTVAAADSPWSDDELVVGVALDGEARAYPLAILVWHELVNDRLAGRPVLVSYCPLCGTAMVFDRRVGEETLRFGVSGLLYQSDLLMFDRQSESLWSQVSARAETGPRLGQRLKLLRSRLVPWSEWLAAHPGTTVLSRRTGHRRDYDRTPYRGYDRSRELYFPVSHRDRRYHPKERTVGLRTADGRARAYPRKEVVQAGGDVSDTFAGRAVRVRWDATSETFVVEAADGLDVIEGFWFAWAAFHPETEVFEAGAESH